jgi:hypothetical protein
VNVVGTTIDLTDPQAEMADNGKKKAKDKRDEDVEQNEARKAKKKATSEERRTR